MTRTALVTGASGGIGRAAALALARDAHRVACGWWSDEVGAKETVRAVEEAGGEARAFRSDVADDAGVEDLLAGVTAWAGPPLVLVASAGVSRDGLAVRYPPEAFRHTLDVNLTGAFLAVRGVLPGMLRARWGRIVLVSSVAGLTGNPGQAAYSASKAGLIGMARSVAREVASRGITVNAVCPGVIDTPMTEALGDEARQRLVDATPARRAGTPEEVGAVIRFLAGDDASYVNGAVLTVDGGMTA